MAGMEDDDSAIWPSTLPPCPVAASWVTAIQIAMAQQMDEVWKQTPAEGFPFKEIDWTPTKPTHRTGGPEPTAMKFEQPPE
jgi:hypothetical protein